MKLWPCFLFIVSLQAIGLYDRFQEKIESNPSVGFKNLENNGNAKNFIQPNVESHSTRNVRSTDTLKAKGIVSGLRNVLRSFIEDRHLNTIKFDMVLSKIRQAFLETEQLINEEFSLDFDLVEKMKGVKVMFQAMVTLNEFYKNDIANFTRDDRLYWEVSELQMELLSLFTAEGTPDFEFEGFHGIVDDVEKRFFTLKGVLRASKRSSSFYRMILSIQFNKVEVGLRDLKGQIIATDSHGSLQECLNNATKTLCNSS